MSILFLIIPIVLLIIGVIYFVFSNKKKSLINNENSASFLKINIGKPYNKV